MDMKRLMNRWIALLVALTMLLGACLAFAEGETAPEPSEESTVKAIETAAPQKTQAPEKTEAPKETEEPPVVEESEEPKESVEPKADEETEPSEEMDEPESPQEDASEESIDTFEAQESMVIAAEEGAEDGLNGTTDPVDNSTTLADGSYVPEDFSYSGGTGKTKISCSEVIVSGGKSSAKIAFSSKNYSYVKANGQKFDDVQIVDGHSTFTIPVALNVDNTIIGMTTAMSEPQEIAYKIHVKLSETTAPSEPENPDYEDGDYDFGITSGYKMFKIASSSATVKDGKIFVTIVTSGTNYDRIYLGSKDDADKSNYVQGKLNDAGNGYIFTFELPKSYMGKSIDFVPGKEDGSWYLNNQYQLTIPESLGDKIEDPEDPEEPEDPETPVVPDDGDYTIEVGSSFESMFRVVKAILSVKDGKYTAVITLSGTGYDMLFLGTAADAETADASAYISFVPDADGMYTYTISVPALDVPFDVAAHSIKSDKWFDRQLTFKSSTLKEIGSEGSDSKPTATPKPDPTKAPEADTSGSTRKVNNSTKLADGTYKPDSFSFSGGTGKVRITCTKITISGGKATATIVFSSPNYGYVKANGRTYYGSHTGSSSTFEIPVELNKNNRIIGMTTAMSQPHEVEYTIFIGLKAALADGEAAAADAPEIAGLTYEATDETASAKLFKIHRFEGGIVEIVVEDVGSYLVYDQGAVLPAGLEDSVVLIERPVENAYLALSRIYEFAQKAGGEAAVKLAGFENDNITFAGEYTAPEYAALMLGSCDLAVMPELFADARVQGTADEADTWLIPGLTDENAALLAEVRDRLNMLDVPMFVDRSSDEESEAGRLEWLKVYGVLFNCESQANAAYAAAAA